MIMYNNEVFFEYAWVEVPHYVAYILQQIYHIRFQAEFLV